MTASENRIANAPGPEIRPGPAVDRQYVLDPQKDWLTEHIPKFERFLVPLRGMPCRAIEVGTHEGRTSLWLLDNILTHPDARLLTIDVRREGRFRQNAANHPERHKLKSVLGRSQEILRRAAFDSVSFIYIDGDHGTVPVLEDAVLAFPLLRVGGVLAFDDYLWDDPRHSANGTPKPAIDAFLSLYAGRIEVLSQDWQVWVRKIAP